jgi:tetratricopeptide (TPR) repeat protein
MDDKMDSLYPRGPAQRRSGCLLRIVVGAAVLILIVTLAVVWIMSSLSPGFQYFNEGQALEESSNLEGAIAAYSAAIEADDQYVVAYTKRGIAYAKLGYLNQAIEDFTMVIKLKPEDKAGYFNRGRAYAMAIESEAALADMERVIEMDSRDALAHLNSGLILTDMGRYQEAINRLERAIELGLKPEDRKIAENAIAYIKSR